MKTNDVSPDLPVISPGCPSGDFYTFIGLPLKRTGLDASPVGVYS